MSEEVQSPVEVIEEAPQKPGILRILAPFMVTGLIFWWILRGMDFVALKAAFAQARLSLAVTTMAGYCAVFLAVDVASFGLGYKWYLTDRVSWREAAIIRGGMYLLQVALAPVAEIIPPTYFWRKYRVRALHTIGSEIYVLFCDGYCNVTILSAGLIMAGVSLGEGWLYFVVGMWALLGLTWLYWLTPLRERILPRLRNAAIMHGFRNAPLKHYFAFYGIRGVLAVANLAAGWVLLDAFDVHLPLHHLFLLVPVMMFSTFLPISAGGYGGPQGAAVLLLVTMYGHTTREIATAYSLLWSTFFALGRAIIGAVLAWPVWSLLQEKAPLADADNE